MNPQVRFHQALLAASIVVPLLLFGLSAWISKKEVFREAEGTIERTATILHEHARKVFDSADLILAHVNSMAETLTDDQIAEPQVSDELRKLTARFDQVVSIWIANADGTVLAGSQPWRKPGTIAPRDFFTVHREKDIGSYVSPAFVGVATNASSFAVSRRRSAADGSFKGTLHVALNPAYFTEFFSEAAPRLSGSSTLVRNDGAILARYPATTTTKFSPNNLVLLAIGTNPQRGTTTGVSQLDNIERTFSYWRVDPFPIYTVFAVDTDAITRQWLGNIVPSALGTAFAIVTLVGMAYLALNRAKTEAAAIAKLQVEMRQRIDTEDRLRHAQRLEAVGQLTGGVAHDFNNLLMIIIGNAERIAATMTPEKLTRARNAIITAGNHGVNLTRQLLAFARRQALLPEIIDVGEAIANLRDMMNASLRGDINLVIDTERDPLRIKVDGGELKLAILNLVVNARDAMPTGGKVTLSARRIVIDQTGKVDHLGPGAYVAISVADTGVGISQEVLSKVFEPFFTTKDVGQGTGLGLSQVHGFTHQSGGTTVIDSALGAGTSVTMYLPCTEDAPVSAESAPRPDDALRGRILLVEDNVAVADVTRDNLEQSGHTVTYAENADSAAEMLERGETFDLILSDIVMPGKISGADFARLVRAQHPQLPVVLMTGYNRSNADLSTEGFKVLAKPFPQEQLEQTVQECLKMAS